MSDQAPVSAPAAPANEGGDPAAQGDEQQAAPKAKAKVPSYRQIKVGNETISLSDEDIARDYGKWKGADAKFRENAAAQKQIDAFREAFTNDPEKVLSDPRIPKDVRKKLAEKWLVSSIEEELTPADPRDAKLSEAERRLKEYEERDENDRLTKEETAQQAKVQQHTTRLADTIRKAGQMSHLSADPQSEAGLVREMAMYMRAAAEQGETVTPEQLVEHIHGQRFQQFYALANTFEGDDLIEFLGEGVVGKLRKADLARLKKSRDGGQSHRSGNGEQRRESNGSRETIDPSDLRIAMRDWK